MSNIVKKDDKMDILERVVVMGDLASLSPEDRVMYYRAVCESVGLNPLTRPLDYITLNGKLTLYAKKDATDQLRKMHGVSITKLERDTVGDVYSVTAYAQDRDGRVDISTGAVSVKNLGGDALANAAMKAETKAKRRVTLSICGLGMLDETEIDTIHNATPSTVTVDGVALPPVSHNNPPAKSAMTIEEAEAEWSQTIGAPYGTLPDDVLDRFRVGLENAKSLTDEQSRKLAAINIILDARAMGRPVQLPEQGTPGQQGRLV